MMPDGNYHDCCMLDIMCDIALGMRGLHEQGTLHRDLKASNVFIESHRFFDNLKKED
jgi:serine/threonine protein kinase